MKRAATILSVFAAFFLVTSYTVSWAGVEPETPIVVDPNEPFEELETLPLLPQDPKALPKEIKEFLSEEDFTIFDMSIVRGDLNGYPFPHAKVSLLVRNKAVVVMTIFLGDDLDVPDLDENSILEIKWFSTDPNNVNSPSLRMKQWINYLLIQKIIEEMTGKKSDEKITI